MNKKSPRRSGLTTNVWRSAQSNFAPVRLSKTVLIPDSSFVELCILILTVSEIPDSLSWIPDTKVQDSGFHKQKSPRNPEYGLYYMGDKLFILLPDIIGYFWRRVYVTGHIKTAFLLIAKTVSRSRSEHHCELLLGIFHLMITIGYFVE